MVGQSDPPQLDVVFGRNAQLGMNFEIGVTLAELCPSLRENSFVIFGCAQGRLIGSGPEFSRRHVAQIKERAPAIASCILAPAGDGEIMPATVTATGVTDSDVVAAIGSIDIVLGEIDR